MRIGVIGPRDPVAGDFFADHIAAALHRMGHRADRLGTTHPLPGAYRLREVTTLALRASPRLDAKLQQHLAHRARDFACDAVISTDANLAPSVVAELRRAGVPVGLWFPDCVGAIGRERMLAAPYTALFFKDPVLVRQLTDLIGVNAHYLPEACDPEVHRPIGAAGRDRRIVVVGSTRPSRILLIRRLHEAGIPIAIYGGPPTRDAVDLLPPGLHRGVPLFGEAKSRVFRGAAGVLNHLHFAEARSVNCRLFEATGAGAAVLCERRGVLPELYDTDREVLPFSTFDELLELATGLLDEPHRTAEIGDAASKRAHAEHTYEHRLPTILEQLS